MYGEQSEDERKKNLIKEAKKELVIYESLKHLLTNNDLGAEITCCGLSIGVCDNSKLIPAVEYTIQEIKKAIKGKPNDWE